MTKLEADKLSEKHQELKDKHFESNHRKDRYIVLSVDTIEHPVTSNDFNTYIGFKRLNCENTIVEQVDFFLNEYSQIIRE